MALGGPQPDRSFDVARFGGIDKCTMFAATIPNVCILFTAQVATKHAASQTAKMLREQGLVGQSQRGTASKLKAARLLRPEPAERKAPRPTAEIERVRAVKAAAGWCCARVRPPLRAPGW